MKLDINKLIKLSKSDIGDTRFFRDSKETLKVIESSNCEGCYFDTSNNEKYCEKLHRYKKNIKFKKIFSVGQSILLKDTMVKVQQGVPEKGRCFKCAFNNTDCSSIDCNEDKFYFVKLKI